jgi:hypothetical protein
MAYQRILTGERSFAVFAHKGPRPGVLNLATLWSAYRKRGVGSNERGGGVLALTAALMSLRGMLATDAVNFRTDLGYPKMFPLGKCLVAESALHIAL